METTSVIARVRMVRALSNPNFALLWLGQSISSSGNAAFIVALAWQVIGITGSATAVGLVVIAQSLPQTLFLIVGGVTADRISRRTVMLWSDTTRGIAVTTIGVLGALHVLQLWHLLVLGLFFGVVRSFFDPAYMAIVPLVAPSEMLPSANALTSLSQQAGKMLGPLLGVLLVVSTGPTGAFAFDGLTFAVSAACLLAIRPAAYNRPPNSETRPETHQQGAHTPRSLWVALLGDLTEGLRYVGARPWLWISLLITALCNMVLFAPIAVALPRLAHDMPGSGVWLLGVVSTASALGAVLATLLIGHLTSLPRPGMLVFCAVILASLSLAALGLPLPLGVVPWSAAVASACFGFGMSAADLSWLMLVQKHIPGDKLGRISSLDLLASFCLVPLGYLLAGILTDQIGPSLVFVLGGLVGVVMAISALTLPTLRRLD